MLPRRRSHREVAIDLYDLDVVAVEVKIDIGVANSQIGEGDLRQPFRKRWGDDQAVGWRVGVDAGERRDEVDDGARGPGLGDVCSQVLDGKDPSSRARPANTSGSRACWKRCAASRRPRAICAAS